MFEEVLQLISSGVGKAFPSAAVAIGAKHQVFVRQFFGHSQILPEKHEITEDTLFDLASLSKLVSTTMVALKFIETGKLSLYDRISKFLDYTGNFGDCEIRHLMTHTSGMTAHLQLYSPMICNKNDAVDTILASEKLYNTDEEVLYSCMGYIVLQRVLEMVGGKSLDKLAAEYVFQPLGMKKACYNPLNIKKDGMLTSVAATEKYDHTGEWATGHVHDENAYFLGGVSGNAGVFATLDDMIFFAGMCSAKGIAPDGEIYLSRQMFNTAIKNYTSDKSESRGLGFQIKGNQAFPCGKLMSEGSYGHTGFTGTSLYVDKDTGLWGILLTNAIHYGRENRGEYFALRRAFYDMIITEYNNSKDDI